MKFFEYKYEYENAIDFCKSPPSNSIKLINTSPTYK